MSEPDFEGYLTEQFQQEPTVEPQEPESTPVETVAETTEPEPQPEPVLLAGKYKSPEDLEAAYKNLEREKGRLAQEVGELRQQTYEPPQPAPTPVDPSAVEDAFVQNPAAARAAAQSAAQRALQQGDSVAYEQIIETWGQYDQFGALRYDGAIRAAQASQQIAAQIAPQVQTATQYADQHANEAATRNVQTRHPDFAQVVGDLTDETRVAQIIEAGFPPQLIDAANGTQADKERLLETLYRWMKADQAEHVAQATSQAEAQAAETNRAVKQQSAVASASSHQASEGTSEDTELEQFYSFLKSPSPTSWADIRPAGQ